MSHPPDVLTEASRHEFFKDEITETMPYVCFVALVVMLVVGQ